MPTFLGLRPCRLHLRIAQPPVSSVTVSIADYETSALIQINVASSVRSPMAHHSASIEERTGRRDKALICASNSLVRGIVDSFVQDHSVTLFIQLGVAAAGILRSTVTFRRSDAN